jgi:hypothetical protein
MFEFIKQFLAGDKPTVPIEASQRSEKADEPDEELLASIATYRKQMYDAADSALAANQRDAERDYLKIERAERFLRKVCITPFPERCKLD